MWIDVTNCKIFGFFSTVINIKFIYIINVEHFIVWMRTAGLPDFRKLWGKIKTDLDPGEYIITIQNSKHRKTLCIKYPCIRL